LRVLGHRLHGVPAWRTHPDVGFSKAWDEMSMTIVVNRTGREGAAPRGVEKISIFSL
jgi:hypothetical protein